MSVSKYVKPPRRSVVSYTLPPNVIVMVKKAAKKDKVPASRLVEAILRERLEKEETK